MLVSSRLSMNEQNVSLPRIGDTAPEFAALDTKWIACIRTWPGSRISRRNWAWRSPTRRNIDEIIRLVQALQTADQYACACPVNWRPGEKVVVPPPKQVADVQE